MNYQMELDQILMKEEIKGKRLLLHSCCAPCSSYVLTYLRPFFRITVYYYNPNITEEEEYQKRLAEEKRFIQELNAKGDGAYPIEILDCSYDSMDFFHEIKGYEDCPEGGERCAICFRLRLKESVRAAREGGYDFYTTTLTISPLKNASLINEIGEELGKEYGVPFLPSDFKKRDGYKKSIELSKEYNLYRQNYCGCIFSKRKEESGRDAEAFEGEET